MLSSVPVAYVADHASPSERAQALSLLRTAIDIGFLVGASSAGVLATMTSVNFTLQCSGTLLAAAVVAFGSKKFFTNPKSQK